MNDKPTEAQHGGPWESAIGTAIVGFERGEMELSLVRRAEGVVWLNGRTPFGCPLASIAAAVQFLREVCEIYNLTLGQSPKTQNGEQEQKS